MQINKNREDLLKPVFDLIREYAPNTYEAMEAAYWPVTMVMNSRDWDDIAGQLPPGALNYLTSTLASSLGVTCQPWDDLPATPMDNRSWLNGSMIALQALQNGWNAVKLAAVVLVHEWTHRRGYGEREAYAASAKFARTIGEEAMAKEEERLGRQESLRELMGAS